jgi:hypothetical protein
MCDKKMSFAECELAILRANVEEIETKQSKELASSKEIMEMVTVVEEFLRKRRLVCYGGTAVNNILPKDAQFYNKEMEVPDYDFYSPNALEDAKILADIFHEKKFSDVQATAGVHHGTYKVYVNFIAIADITLLHPTVFKSMTKEAVELDGILYCPPNFLRMNMYLELSRPAGDVSRWEKIYKRLTLLNEHYPFDIPKKCTRLDFKQSNQSSGRLYDEIRNALIDNGVVFFGGYATRLYSQYMPKTQREMIRKIPDFDVLSDSFEHCANMLIERLKLKGFSATKRQYDGVGEITPERIDIIVKKDVMVSIYKPIACHNYNVITIEKREVKVATIDTILSFYLAFYYSDHSKFSKDRLMCMCKFLFELRKSQKKTGLLQKFSMTCYGTQPTLETIRAEKMRKFEELRDKRGTAEYDEWFLKYVPSRTEKPHRKTEKKQRPVRKRKTEKNKKTKHRRSASIW